MEIRMSNKIFSLTSAIMFGGSVAFADVPKVVADIAPVHSLVARVMSGVGNPNLIIPAGASPHDYQMRPSEARSIQDADIIFWMGEDLTPWLSKALSSLAEGTPVSTLLEVDGIDLLDFREGALFEAHDDHDDHKDDDDHDDHKDDDDHDDHDDHKDDDDHDDHDDHEGHAHGDHDPHAWLSPTIAKVWLNEIAAKLSAIDPDNAGAYFSNAASAKQDLDSLSAEINMLLDPIRDKKFVVFHDAYQYFEKDFNISASGAISLGDASNPSPARLAEVRNRVIDESIQCVLAEPQFKQGLVAAVVEGTDANTAVIDPLGVGLDVGPSLYEDLIRKLASNLAKCF